MNRMLWIFAASVLLVSAAAGIYAEPRVQRRAPAPRPIVVAAETSFEDKKQSYLVDTGREIGLLAAQVSRLSQITPTDGGTNSGFAEAKRVFDEKASILQSKLGALRATPADSAQSAMDDVDAALKDLRDAYSQVLGAAK